MSPFDPSKTLVIHNPVSGRPSTRRRARALVDRLAERGMTVARTQGPGGAVPLGRRVAEEGFAAAVCVGGDGTLFEALSEMPASAAVAMFPTGTVNLFARSMGIPRKRSLWMEMLETGGTRDVFFARANGRPFTSVASVGFDALVVEKVSRRLKKLMQEGAYAWQAVVELPRYRVPEYRVTLDGDVKEGPFVGILVGKQPYYGGPHVTFPTISQEEPRLAIALLRGRSRAILAKYAVALGVGRLGRLGSVEFLEGERLTVETDRPEAVELDGDAFGKTPVTFEVEKEPRRVLAVPSREGSPGGPRDSADGISAGW